MLVLLVLTLNIHPKLSLKEEQLPSWRSVPAPQSNPTLKIHWFIELASQSHLLKKSKPSIDQIAELHKQTAVNLIRFALL